MLVDRDHLQRHALGDGRRGVGGVEVAHVEAALADLHQSLLLAGHVYAGLGKKEKAMAAQQRGLDVAESSLLLDPGDIRALYLGANGLASMGEKGKALEWLERALALQPHDPMLLYNAGCVYAILGMTTEALSCLEQAYEEGITQRGWYANDSNLDSLRAHPRFQALLGKMSSN